MPNSIRNFFSCILLLLIVGCKSQTLSLKETTNQAVKELGPNPYFVVNGEPVDQKTFVSLNKADISTLSIIYGKEATDLFNENGKDGVITVQTKTYAINKFQSTFKALSDEYNEMIDMYKDSEIQYILNKKILKEDFEGTLSFIDETLLKSIKIIDSTKLSRKYGIIDKKVGVVIKSKPPKDLYNSKKKF
ncbi:hypothetical protein H2O64_01105 [Kordia sp. YSTF-M3]|uniref:DUF4252 domain-containing protein n=1 Tax=Kordia aestuariivivens TaxID=2759037 RepID=A0ABR7Q400_9FLAO|nr:hypothetical protein [Kordia aestuariivivens]MBC8753247.1 hypothetical protein [Kordia aestuariivivens]